MCYKGVIRSVMKSVIRSQSHCLTISQSHNLAISQSNKQTIPQSRTTAQSCIAPEEISSSADYVSFQKAKTKLLNSRTISLHIRFGILTGHQASISKQAIPTAADQCLFQVVFESWNWGHVCSQNAKGRLFSATRKCFFRTLENSLPSWSRAHFGILALP